MINQEELEKGPQGSSSMTQDHSTLPLFTLTQQNLLEASQQSGTCIDKVLLNKLLSFIKKCNVNQAQVMTEGTVHRQFTRLYKIERIAYEWQREHNAKANATDRAAMNMLLKELEEHHQDLVTQNRAAHYPLWIKPGTDSKAEAEMRKLWESITHGEGNIKLSSSASLAFTNSIYASVAKLLQTALGREILSTLNKDQPSDDRNVWIGATWQEQFANLPGQPEWKPGSWAVPYAITQDRENTCHRASEKGPGSGTGSYVQIDLTPLFSSLVAGERDEPLYMPDFITLGHELGHAFHNLTGQALDIMGACEGYPFDEIEQELWSEPEEYQNITINENTLRDEHGLPKRKYHGNAKAVQDAEPLRRRRALQDRQTQAEGKIPHEVCDAVYKRLPQLEALGEILVVGYVGEDENIRLWSVPGELEKAELLMREVEANIDRVIKEEQEKKDRVIAQKPKQQRPAPTNEKCDIM